MYHQRCTKSPPYCRRCVIIVVVGDDTVELSIQLSQPVKIVVIKFGNFLLDIFELFDGFWQNIFSGPFMTKAGTKGLSARNFPREEYTGAGEFSCLSRACTTSDTALRKLMALRI